MDPLASGRGAYYVQANDTGLSSSGNASNQSLDRLKNILITTQEMEHDIDPNNTMERANLYLEHFENLLEVMHRKANQGDKDAIECLPLLYTGFYIKALLILTEGPRTEPIRDKYDKLFKDHSSHLPEKDMAEMLQNNPAAAGVLRMLRDRANYMDSVDTWVKAAPSGEDRSEVAQLTKDAYDHINKQNNPEMLIVLLKEDVRNLQNSVVLILSYSDITELPPLPPDLTHLSLLHCTKVAALPDALPDSLTFIDLEGCTGLTHMPVKLPPLVFLSLRGCAGVPVSTINKPASLMLLDIAGTGLTQTPELSMLTQLKYLKMSHNKLTVFPDVSLLSKELKHLDVRANPFTEKPDRSTFSTLMKVFC